MASEGLFSKEIHQQNLHQVSDILDSRREDWIQPTGLTKHLAKMLRTMARNAEKFDTHTPFNLRWIGHKFFEEIRNHITYSSSEIEKQSESTEYIFNMAFRFFCEFDLTSPQEQYEEHDFLLKFIEINLHLFSKDKKQQLIYAMYMMPVAIFKELFKDPELLNFKNFKEKAKEAKQLIEGWDQNLVKRENYLNALKDNLSKVTSSYNFAGLSEGFQNLKKTKENERNYSFWPMLLLGFLMIVLPLLEIIVIFCKIELIDAHLNTLIFIVPTIFVIEFILIYFFRVVLVQFRSVKTQLLQIDLRITICQFIEGYGSFMAEYREKDPTVLAKFEALIFSSLVTDGAEIPSTFDGADQLAGLIRSIRGDKKE